MLLHVPVEGLLVERLLSVVAGGDEPLEVVERELRVHRDELVHPDHRVDPLARPEGVLEVVGIRRERVAQEVAEQDLADPTAGLRRAKRLLESSKVVRAREHLSGGAVELAEPLDEIGRGLARALLGREQTAVEPLEPPVDLRLELGEAPVDRLRDPAERARGDAAVVAQPPIQPEGEPAAGGEHEQECQHESHEPTNPRDPVGRRRPDTNEGGSRRPRQNPV